MDITYSSPSTLNDRIETGCNPAFALEGFSLCSEPYELVHSRRKEWFEDIDVKLQGLRIRQSSLVKQIEQISYVDAFSDSNRCCQSHHFVCARAPILQ